MFVRVNIFMGMELLLFSLVMKIQTFQISSIHPNFGKREKTWRKSIRIFAHLVSSYIILPFPPYLSFYLFSIFSFLFASLLPTPFSQFPSAAGESLF